jgi:hypothetical protein
MDIKAVPALTTKRVAVKILNFLGKSSLSFSVVYLEDPIVNLEK